MAPHVCHDSLFTKYSGLVQLLFQGILSPPALQQSIWSHENPLNNQE